MTKLINVLLVILVTGLTAVASPKDSVHVVQHDTTQLQHRAFDRQTLEEFRSDPDYQYGRPREGLSFMERIMIFIVMIISKMIRFATDTLPGQIIFYGLCAALILWVILKILNIDAKDLFFRSGKSSRINFKVAEEDIHALDFEKLIQAAVEKKEYRDAVRLIFLFSLKKLSDAQLIQWMPGKTNDEYLAELEKHPAKSRLQELRYYFDYAWYGHFDVSDHTMNQVRNTFNEFNSKL